MTVQSENRPKPSAARGGATRRKRPRHLAPVELNRQGGRRKKSEVPLERAVVHQARDLFARAFERRFGEKLSQRSGGTVTGELDRLRRKVLVVAGRLTLEHQADQPRRVLELEIAEAFAEVERADRERLLRALLVPVA